MKKTITSILIILVIPLLAYVGFYVYQVSFYKYDSLTHAYFDEKNPKKKMVLVERKLNKDEYQRWAWLDVVAELAYRTKDYEKAEMYSL